MQLAEVFERVIGAGTPVEFRAYDGSRSGPADAQVRVWINSPRAVSYLVLSPGELGLARAYVVGDVDVDGDIHTTLRLLAQHASDLPWRERLEILRSLGLRALRPYPPPEVEIRQLPGRRHSKRRDGQAISHHYDVSNQFYEWVLGPSMAYTCAVYPHSEASLEEAQYTKFDLVARKLGLRPGMRLLDVGCGWGGMVRHAAREYGVRALGVTLSRQQAEWGQKAIADAGLSDLAEVRHLDYRDVPETAFDAISSIGLTEHIGMTQLPAYFDFLAGKLRPQGRLLNHCITRPTSDWPPNRRRGFINRYVFPDGEILGIGHIASVMAAHGFEIRHEENLREHYALTLRDWGANLERHWAEAVAEVGAAQARVWRLYMAGSRLSFDQNALQLHQILGVRTDAGTSGMPLRSDWEPVSLAVG
jgi:cyclopropane-fatty-acyl-phospholipid synthase